MADLTTSRRETGSMTVRSGERLRVPGNIFHGDAKPATGPRTVGADILERRGPKPIMRAAASNSLRSRLSNALNGERNFRTGDATAVRVFLRSSAGPLSTAHRLVPRDDATALDRAILPKTSNSVSLPEFVSLRIERMPGKGCVGTRFGKNAGDFSRQVPTARS